MAVKVADLGGRHQNIERGVSLRFAMQLEKPHIPCLLLCELFQDARTSARNDCNCTHSATQWLHSFLSFRVYTLSRSIQKFANSRQGLKFFILAGSRVAKFLNILQVHHSKNPLTAKAQTARRFVPS